MTSRTTGRFQRIVVGGENIDVFIPVDLPPKRPPLVIEGVLAGLLSQAEHALARLDLAGTMVPSLDWFIYGFVRKEAVLSSQIEGTQATLLDLLTFEAEDSPAPNAEVEEVCNYLDALAFARGQLSIEQGLPLSTRLLNETHRRLMRGVRGANKEPGEIRRSQNWIGGSRPGNALYVPPPPHMLDGLLGAFEKYVHVRNGLPALIRAGLLHVQFETIHPYLDGNGRIGRLLVTLLLEHWGLLKSPLLYLSLYFKRHRDEYYRRLNRVRSDGDWEGWTEFFLKGVASVADEAVDSAQDLYALINADRAKVLAFETTSVSAIRLFELLPRHPILSIASSVKLLGATKPTATRAVEMLVDAGILIETTGKKRDRSFAYGTYLDRLRSGTELDLAR